MSGKEYTSYNLFFIHHEGHEVSAFSSCSSCLRGKKIMRNSGMFFHGNDLK